MSYIGNQPTSVAFLTDQFSGNASTTVFTMSVAPATTSSILVNITGVTQDPTTYAVSGTTLTFSAAPPTGTGNISVRYLGIPASGVVTTAYRTVTEFTATAGQTSFSVPSYTIGYIDVFRNGVRLGSTDYTATTGTTVVLAVGAIVGDLVTTESFYVSSVLNAIPATAGAVNSTYISSVLGSVITGTQNIPKAALPTGSVLQVVNATYSTQTSTTSTSPTDTGLTATITPTSATSKVLVFVSQTGLQKNAANIRLQLQLLRGATVIDIFDVETLYTASTGGSAQSSSTCYLDAPTTTSATIYKTQALLSSGAGTAVWCVSSSVATITLMEIAG